MDAEQVGDLGRHLLGSIGYPRENPPRMVPMDPEMKKGMAAVNAHIEAQRLEAEAGMDTAENRKKAVEAGLAEKRRAWGARAWAMPLDGFKGIYGATEETEMKVYTRTYDLKHKFWGVKPVGMTIDDFWDLHDPQVERYDDANQETPASPEISMTGSPPMDPRQCIKPTAEPRRRQKLPHVTPTNRIGKSTTVSPKVNKSTRKSLADKVDSEHRGLGDQMREVAGTAHAAGRLTRKKEAVTASGAQQEPAVKDEGSAPFKRSRGRPATKAKPAMQDITASPPKRSRGRPSFKPKPAANDADAITSVRPRGCPPAKGKLAEKPPKQKKTPAVKGNSRISKSRQEKRRPAAPSTHKMRTRGEGPAELVQLP